ncbi:Gfa-like protein [hydrothermal vent metagenome]|uniref:Gfa-like protein n=1 Tax=hydrothermal vent metagenome TaxID=652676 RepID=A0A3B0Y2V9_9ZZZZ
MSGMDFSGGCLCGSIQYKINGDVMRFYHCHCSRCRKMTGTGHATNIMVKADTVEWLKSESLLGYYKVPKAERFYSQFCKQCGSPLPRRVPELGMVVIPAGSLDSDPGINPEARIFWDSRAEWSCEAGGLPTFSEYPET